MSVDPLQSPSEGTGDDALPVEALKEASKRLSFSTGAVVDKKVSEKSHLLTSGAGPKKAIAKNTTVSVAMLTGEPY